MTEKPVRLVDGKTYDEHLAELEPYTLPEQARQIVALRFGLGGDNIELDPEGQQEPTATGSSLTAERKGT